MTSSRWSVQHLDRILALIVWSATGAYALVIIHSFFGYIGGYPYLALDEALANVSYALAMEGRYGFIASPMQGSSDVLRHDGFFNYGPWYFYLGAAVIWLFGYSLTALRGIHLVVILVCAFAAMLWFRGHGRLAGGVTAMCLLYIFDLLQWPMVRPDAMVSLFAVAFVLAAGQAIRTRSRSFWFAAGLAATCGAFTHLIAWSLVPACGLAIACAATLGWHAEASKNIEWRAFALDLAAAAFGAGIALWMFYASFDYRIADHVATLAGYQKFVSQIAAESGGPSGYGLVLAKHLYVAYGGLAKAVQVAIAVVFLASWLVSLLALCGWAHARAAAPYVLPPILAWTAYALSLGTYPNYHSGYAILSQVLAAWCAGALIFFLLDANRDRTAFTRSAILIGCAAMVFIVGSSLIARAAADTSKIAFSKKSVPVADYTDAILHEVPEAATAWGTVMFGIESPRRVQLVQFIEGVTLASRASASDRARLAPEFIVWGYPENRDNTFFVLRGDPSLFARLRDLFPHQHYALVSMVGAAPYGVTRVLRRVQRGSNDELPRVSVYDPISRAWETRLSAPLPTRVKRVAPVRIGMGYGAKPPLYSATYSVVTDLPGGKYLLKVTFDGADGNGIVVATSASEYVTQVSELGPPLDVAPYSGVHAHAYLIYQHDGGPLYVSQFAAQPGATLASIEARTIFNLDMDAEGSSDSYFQGLPAMEAWSKDTPSGVRATPISGGTRIDGNSTQFGYQIVSPPLDVQGRRTAILRLKYRVVQGSVCVGVLNESMQQWIITPNEARTEYSFDPGANRTVHVVFANCNALAIGNAATQFEYFGGSYWATGETDFYVDQLVRGSRRSDTVQSTHR